jgi:hypothetical protein
MWQAAWVDPWTIGLTVLVVLGLAAIVYGALSDRAKNRRRAAQLLAPPERSIPQFAPQGSPRYVTELQARRPPSDAPGLSSADRQLITEQLVAPETATVSAGYASKDFITDLTSGWAVLDQPAVLVCGESVDSIRELLPTLEKLIATHTPLVVVAPGFAGEVLSTLEVNAIRRTLSLLAVQTAAGDGQAIAAAAGATVTDRSDRQAGYLPPEHLGHCARWVATAKQSHLIHDVSHPVL